MNFDWQIDEDEPELARRRRTGRASRPWLWWLLGIVIALTAVVWGWGQWQIIQTRQQTHRAIQTVLDEQASLWANGQIDRFLDQSPPNAVWQADQFRPENIAFWTGRPEVTDFERREGEIWANVSWTLPTGEVRQRALFFEERSGEMVLRDSAFRFWGAPRRAETSYGSLRLYESDLIWQEQFHDAVTSAAEQTCGALCPPLDVEISNRLAVKAGSLVWPSPRILGLDPRGNPPVAYWEGLRQAVADNLAPDELFFAVPPDQINIYRELAADYEALTGQQIDIVRLDQWPSADDMLADVDGAALVPTLGLIQSGAVQELTDLAFSDQTFDSADYYEQLWQGGFWRERLWMLPQSARLSLIYVDRELYRANGVPLPGYSWTWEQLWADAAVFLDAGQVTWALATPNDDWLYSLAYNAGNRCIDEVTVNCSPRLRRQDVAAALEIFATYHSQVPQYTGLTPREVAIAYQNEISLQTRRSAVWVDEPLQYEQNFLSRAARVLPYPGTGDFPGVTPLWVDGYVISSAAESPQAVWGWLTFLSHHYLVRTSRHIPARPSVATAAGYWERLPPALAEAMIQAFPFSRPVLLAEREVFTDEMLNSVAEGSLTPAEAAGLCAACTR